MDYTTTRYIFACVWGTTPKAKRTQVSCPLRPGSTLDPSWSSSRICPVTRFWSHTAHNYNPQTRTSDAPQLNKATNSQNTCHTLSRVRISARKVIRTAQDHELASKGWRMRSLPPSTFIVLTVAALAHTRPVGEQWVAHGHAA